MRSSDAIVMNATDNVATALADLARSQSAAFEVGGRVMELKLTSDIPFGHKFALRPLAPGQEVIKYGEVIGVASGAIAPGEHVHTHNMERSLGRAI